MRLFGRKPQNASAPALDQGLGGSGARLPAPDRTMPATSPVPPYPAAPVTAPGARCAVLLVNLGTPDAPTAPALRRYLREFLGDPRVVELPRALWLPILYGVILTLRPARSAKAYRAIWTPEGSPLRVLSERLTAALDAVLRAPDLTVRLAMRYGNPGVGPVLRTLREEGVDRLVVLPLYPQYSASTAASVFDAVVDELRTWRHVPELHFIPEYHTEPAWLDAVADSIRTHWATHPRGEKLLFSFHGIPQRYVRNGDPYEAQCRASAAGIVQRLGLADSEWQLSFQSRVGREPWLQPYTDATVRALGAAGVRELDVVCPGFAVDCLETLEEIAMQNAEFFEEAGGHHLRYIPALNDSAAHVAALAGLLRRRGAVPPGGERDA